MKLNKMVLINVGVTYGVLAMILLNPNVDVDDEVALRMMESYVWSLDCYVWSLDCFLASVGIRCFFLSLDNILDEHTQPTELVWLKRSFLLTRIILVVALSTVGSMLLMFALDINVLQMNFCWLGCADAPARSLIRLVIPVATMIYLYKITFYYALIP